MTDVQTLVEYIIPEIISDVNPSSSLNELLSTVGLRNNDEYDSTQILQETYSELLHLRTSMRYLYLSIQNFIFIQEIWMLLVLLMFLSLSCYIRRKNIHRPVIVSGDPVPVSISIDKTKEESK